MSTLTQKVATSGQLRQIIRVAQDAAEKSITEFGLSKNGAQRVHAHGDDLAETVRTAVIASLNDLSVTDKFKNEEVPSKYGYLSGYKPKGLTEQANRLRELFPGLGFANLDYQKKVESGEIKLPTGAEGWFAIPNWKKNEKLFGATYSAAVLVVLEAIRKDRNNRFQNYRENQIDEAHLRQSVRSEKFWQVLAEAQGNPDILIVPAQFGKRHAGRSVRRAIEVMDDNGNEFGPGAFAVGIMLLTHPERLQHYDDLWIDCAGDEFDFSASGVRLVGAPYFRFGSDKVGFDTRRVSGPSEFCGSASGFSPQQ